MHGVGSLRSSEWWIVLSNVFLARRRKEKLQKNSDVLLSFGRAATPLSVDMMVLNTGKHLIGETTIPDVRARASVCLILTSHSRPYVGIFDCSEYL